MRELRLARAIEANALTLTVVEQTRVDHRRGFFYACKEPYAVIVQQGARRYAVGTDGTPIPIAELLEALTEE